MVTRSDVRHARSDYLRKSAAREKLRTRLIFHRKKGERAHKLRKSYMRSIHTAHEAKHHYLHLKAELHKPLRLKARDEARALLGIVEKGGNNTGPEVDRIIRANGGTIGEAWCGDFVAYCYRRAGSKAVTRSWAAAWGGVWGWFAGVRRIDPKNIKPGDIVEYTWQHTGIADSAPDANGDLEVDEGNTGAEGKTSDTTHDGAHKRDRNLRDVKAAFRVTR